MHKRWAASSLKLTWRRALAVALGAAASAAAWHYLGALGLPRAAAPALGALSLLDDVVVLLAAAYSALGGGGRRVDR